jgi:amino acid permease
LTPLAPGERPWALRIAVVLALLIGVADVVQVAVGSTIKFGHTHTSVAGVVLFSVVMLVCALGMWQLRYWAVLGFQALLALVIIAFALVLITANDILRAVASVAVIGLGGWLFFKLVRVLSRLQMPRQGGRP